jgi:hypothetical protein
VGEYEEFEEGLTGRLMSIPPDQKIEDFVVWGYLSCAGDR